MTNQQGRCPIPGCSKVFKAGHSGIDAHVVSAHASLFVGATKPELYADFKRNHPRPWPYAADGAWSHEPRPSEDTAAANVQSMSIASLARDAADCQVESDATFDVRPYAPSSSLGDTVIGVDFAGPKEARQQQRKILAVAARRLGPGHYVVTADGFNARLVQDGPPGWTALELAEALEGPYRAGLVAMDFPFSIPAQLIADVSFSERVACPEAFGSWRALNQFISERLPLACPTDLSAFAGWRDKAYWLLRATEVLAQGQPALKHKFQVLFNMTLLGSALLARLGTRGGYRIEPFDAEDGQAGTVIEIYPGVTMRRLGKPNYKQDPVGAIETLLAFCKRLGITIEVDETVRRRCETYGMDRRNPDPDGSDALIALCTAILYREGRCSRLLENPLDNRVAVEGAIWAPTVSV